MAENTPIEWADDSVGFWWGCNENGPECAHCYARDGYPVAVAQSQLDLPLWQSNSDSPNLRSVRLKIEGAADTLRRLNRKAEKEGRVRLVFINSQSDTFEDTDAKVVRRRKSQNGWRVEVAHSDNGRLQWLDPGAKTTMPLWTLDDERREMFNAIDECHMLRCMLLTKRPGNIRRMCSEVEQSGPACPDCGSTRCQRAHSCNSECESAFGPGHRDRSLLDYHRTNVWLGTSAGTQETADKAIPELLKCRDLSPVLFVSAEPLLGEVRLDRMAKYHKHPSGDPLMDWHTFDNALTGFVSHKQGGMEGGPSIDWVISGGESTAKARPSHPDWHRSLRDQCEAAGVPFFFKQHGEWTPYVSKHPGTPGKFAIVRPDGTSAQAESYPRSFDSFGACVMSKVGKKAAGRLLDGVEHNEFPTTHIEV